MSWLVGFLLALIGLAALSVSMQKHQRQLYGAPLPASYSKAYRRGGSAFVAGAVLWCVLLFGWGQGLVIMCGIATVGSLLVIATMTLKPSVLRFVFRQPRA